MTDHKLRLTLKRRGMPNPHGGVCSCGEWDAVSSNAAGVVLSQHNTHVEQVGLS